VKPDANDPRPPYLQVADDLRAGITAGTFKPGERLPSGRELARRYGGAPMTIHHALGVLRQEQLVESYQGRGVFIANGSAFPAKGRGQAPPDAALKALRGDLNQLAERVARIERRIASNEHGSADSA
jgi:GntR family transcriptional regulator